MRHVGPLPQTCAQPRSESSGLEGVCVLEWEGARSLWFCAYVMQRSYLHLEQG